MLDHYDLFSPYLAQEDQNRTLKICILMQCIFWLCQKFIAHVFPNLRMLLNINRVNLKGLSMLHCHAFISLLEWALLNCDRRFQELVGGCCEHYICYVGYIECGLHNQLFKRHSWTSWTSEQNLLKRMSNFCLIMW